MGRLPQKFPLLFQSVLSPHLLSSSVCMGFFSTLPLNSVSLHFANSMFSFFWRQPGSIFTLNLQISFICIYLELVYLPGREITYHPAPNSDSAQPSVTFYLDSRYHFLVSMSGLFHIPPLNTDTHSEINIIENKICKQKIWFSLNSSVSVHSDKTYDILLIYSVMVHFNMTYGFLLISSVMVHLNMT